MTREVLGQEQSNSLFWILDSISRFACDLELGILDPYRASFAMGRSAAVFLKPNPRFQSQGIPKLLSQWARTAPIEAPTVVACAGKIGITPMPGGGKRRKRTETRRSVSRSETIIL